ncbi:MAG: glycosyltransferase [Nitrospira sp.]
MLTTSYPLSTGDVSGIFIFRLCRALAASDVQVDVVAPANRGASPVERMGGGWVYRFCYFFPERWQGLAYGPGGIPANLSRSPWFFIQVPFFLVMFVIKSLRVARGADIVHAHWIYSGLIAVAVKLVHGIPFVVTLRGSDVLRSKNGKFSALVSRWILRRAALITTVNQDLKRWAISQGVPEERVVFIRNGVDLPPQRQDEDTISQCRLLFVGNLVPGKGVHHLIEALSHVLREEENVHLRVIGDGSEKKRLKEQINHSGLNAVVEFVGVQSPDQIPYWMKKSDCLVLPSLWEGTPNVVLEAMACGLPVVASDLPGISEVMTHGVHGLLSKSEDVQGLAQNLLAVVRNKGLRLQMGARGREEIVRMGLGWDQVAKRYQEVYTRLCAVSRAS